MFTGLIKEIGILKSVETNPEGKLLGIKSKDLIKEIGIDDSVSINGACQTVVKIKGDIFYVQAVHVTLEKTTFGALRPSNQVNLELSLRPMDRLGGHFVSGHVNGVGQISKITSQGKNYLITVKYSKDLEKYIIPEGSIAIDGISLTVAYQKRGELTVSIIPHTYEKTTLGSKKVGDKVNLEVDLLAKYLEKLLPKRT
ncbi:MAG: riboflavin synthase [Bacteriovoracales bacterium]|jgi:riboflavin synthase